MKDNKLSFVQDERAIEGLPIRLVIALVVGVAALGLMLQVLGGFGGVGQTEVDAEIEEGEVINMNDYASDDNITITIVDENGDELEGATILLEPGTAQGDTVEVPMDDGQSTVEIPVSEFLGDVDSEYNANVELPSGQDRGTYEITILPPSDGDFTDDQENPEIQIIDS